MNLQGIYLWHFHSYSSGISLFASKWHHACIGYVKALIWIEILIGNNTHYNVWDEITYPFQNFNGWSSGMD